MNKNYMMQMVREVNSTEVRPDEILSNNVEAVIKEDTKVKIERPYKADNIENEELKKEIIDK